MTSRVFISYRTSDGADKATALARDLDAAFGSEQIFLDKEDLPAGSRWRDEIARAFGNRPILLVLITPDYFGARDADGRRRIEHADDPARDELEAAIAVDARIIPLLCDGVDETPDARTLPPPFDQLSERTWRRLRAYDWREDLARLVDDLRELGVEPRAAAPEISPDGPAPAGKLPAFTADGRRRRGVLAATAAALLAAGAGLGGWRWWQRRRDDLSGAWIARIGARGSRSARDGEVTVVRLRQDGTTLVLESNPVDVRQERDWQNYRDFWKQKTGSDLTHVVYRGRGEVTGDDGGPARHGQLRRVALAIRIHVVGSDGEPIDAGALRAAVDPEDQHIRGKLWIDSEQGERIVDLRRQP